jgi:hypothetical protein
MPSGRHIEARLGSLVSQPAEVREGRRHGVRALTNRGRAGVNETLPDYDLWQKFTSAFFFFFFF